VTASGTEAEREILRTVAIVVAAGPGTRLGADAPKAFVPLGGTPLLTYSLRSIADAPAISSVVVALPPGWEGRGRELLDQHRPWRCPLSIVTGGATRQESVRVALDSVGAADLIAVHDAARPFITSADLERAVAAAVLHGAAILAMAATDTVKQVDTDGWIESTPDRHRIWLAQTPQVFRADLLRTAHARAAEEGTTATDDAMLVERLGARVKVVQGSPYNRKITTPDDLRWAEWVLTHPSALR